MSQTTRTNIVVNGSFETNVTGWTGTNCTQSQSSAQAFTGTKSMALTATTAAAFSAATATGTAGMPVTASTSYAFQAQSRAAATARTVTVSITWYTAAGATISTSSGTGVADTTTGFTQATVAATSPSNAAFASVSIGYNTAASSEIHYVDAVFGEAASSVGSYFDGASVNAGAVMYAWTGTAYASTSTATTYVPAIGLTAGSTPCPNVAITLTDLTPTDNKVNVWRTADGVRTPVRGTRGLTVNGSTVFTDYEVPLGRTVQYDLEIVSGVTLGAVAPSQTITVTAPLDAAGRPTWWIQDPLVPGSAMPLSVARTGGSPSLTAAAVRQLEYASDVNIIPIAGSSLPVAIGGQRLAAQNVPFDMFTNTAQATTNLRNLLEQTSVLLLRPPGTGREAGIPGLFYGAFPKPVEQPVTVAFGGTLTKWAMQGSSVASPTAAILVPIWTYGTVAALWTDYQTPQTLYSSSGMTYLGVQKSPTG